MYALPLPLCPSPFLGASTDAVAPCDWVGFLPVLYTIVASRWRTPSVHLPDESSEDTLEDFSESQKTSPERLTGRRILLLWLPAICDLTGTTVRALPFHSLRISWAELLTYARLGLCSS
jgi:hypothetical protein